MGACASRPKDLDGDLAPAPVPTEDPASPKGETAAAEAPKIEEVNTETKAVVEAESVKKEETVKPTEEVKEEPKEQQPAEEKKEVAEKTKEAETVAQ